MKSTVLCGLLAGSLSFAALAAADSGFTLYDRNRVAQHVKNRTPLPPPGGYYPTNGCCPDCIPGWCRHCQRRCHEQTEQCDSDDDCDYNQCHETYYGPCPLPGSAVE